MSRLVVSASRGQARGQQGTRMFYSASNQKGAGTCMKKDKGFYKHFDLAPMKDNVIQTTGGCKEIGEPKNMKANERFTTSINTKHEKIKSLSIHGEEVAF